MFTVENFITLGLLTLLQAVLGFDNLLYISIESKRAPEGRQALVRRLGIGLAVILRIILLFVLIKLIDFFRDPFIGVHLPGVIESELTLHSLIELLGGVFIVYTATREVLHMMSIEDVAHVAKKPRSVARLVFLIVAMNVVFSFDSILSALALTRVFWVMAGAIVIGGILMI